MTVKGRSIAIKLLLLALAAPLMLAGVVTTAPSVASAAEMESSLARGGRLYDKWYKVIKAETPTEAHAAYPADKAYADKADSNWRCKECHGWDYQGKDGAYASGKHATGIPGVAGQADADPATIVAILTDATHGYEGLMDEADLVDLANFVSQGQVDMDLYIDRATKAPKGDAAKGEAYYNTVCANCHGKDGKAVKDMPPMGKLMGNPWEVMHKILNGQPDEKMPALRAFDPQVTVDIMAHAATLPTE
jgi:cytochrome c553